MVKNNKYFYLKTVVECNCIHPATKEMEKPPAYSFSTLIMIDRNNVVKEKNVKCPNCGRLIRIYDIGKIDIVDSGKYRELQDIKDNIPKKIVDVLESHNCDLATYEEVELLLKNNIYGKTVELTRDNNDEEVSGKLITINRGGLFSIERYNYKNQIVNFKK